MKELSRGIIVASLTGIHLRSVKALEQDMILILDLGSEENPKIAREIRALGVYTEINAHDISAAELMN